VLAGELGVGETEGGNVELGREEKEARMEAEGKVAVDEEERRRFVRSGSDCTAGG